MEMFRKQEDCESKCQEHIKEIKKKYFLDY